MRTIRNISALALLATSLCCLPVSSFGNPSFTQAESAFLDGDHATVVTFANQALASDPSLQDARFLRGMSRYALGNLGLALHDLNTYLASGAPNYRSQAEKMAKTIQPKVGPSTPSTPSNPSNVSDAPLYGAPTPVDRSLGVDTTGVLETIELNPGQPPVETAASLPLRYTVSLGYHYDDRVVLRPVGDEAPEDPISDSAFHLRLNADMSPSEEGYVVRYDADWLRYDKASRESRLAQKVELGWHSPLGTKHHDFEIVGIADLTLLDMEGYRTRFGATATWFQMPGPRRDWAKVRIGRDRYDDFSDYNGIYWGGDIGQDYIVGDTILSWSAGYQDQGAELPEVEFTDTHASVSALWNITDTFAAGAGGAWIDNPYGGGRFDPVFEGTRDDTFLTGQVFFKYKLTDNFSLEPSVTFIQRDSTVSDLEYDRVIAELNAVLMRW